MSRAMVTAIGDLGLMEGWWHGTASAPADVQMSRTRASSAAVALTACKKISPWFGHASRVFVEPGDSHNPLGLISWTRITVYLLPNGHWFAHVEKMDVPAPEVLSGAALRRPRSPEWPRLLHLAQETKISPQGTVFVNDDSWSASWSVSWVPVADLDRWVWPLTRKLPPFLLGEFYVDVRVRALPDRLQCKKITRKAGHKHPEYVRYVACVRKLNPLEQLYFSVYNELP